MKDIEQRFLRDVADHQMIVMRDDDVHRHIRFTRPGSRCMQFDLITWPGHLCYTGDMGTYVFSRLQDMFEFFRTDRRDDGLGINRPYWAEKVLSVDRHGGIKEFSDEEFTREIKEYVHRWIRDNRDDTTRDERRELLEAVNDEVLGAEHDTGGYRRQIAAHEFHHRVNDRVDFCFQDFWETDVQEYTVHFTWCCYALAWGIGKYDEFKANVHVGQDLCTPAA